VPEHFHDVEDIFGFGVFHGCFPVSERVEVDFVYAVILEFDSYFGSLESEGSGKVSVGAAESLGLFFW